mgnify:FL=1
MSKGNTTVNSQQSIVKSQKSTANRQKSKLTYKEQRELEQLEKDIAALEAEKAKIVEELSLGNISTEQVIAHSKRLPELEAELETKEMRWLELSDWQY